MKLANGDWSHNASQYTIVTKRRDTLTHMIHSIEASAMVNAARRAGAPARALREMERAMESSNKTPDISRADCTTLQSIYKDLGDDDAAIGVVRCCRDPDSKTLAWHYERTKRWTDALTCYTSLGDHDKVVEQLAHRGEVDISLAYAEAMKSHEQVAKVGWRLSKWETLESAVEQSMAQAAAKSHRQLVTCASTSSLFARGTQQSPKPTALFDDFEAMLAVPMLAFQKRDTERFSAELDAARLKAADGIRLAAQEENERKLVPHLLQLHILTDLDMLYRRVAANNFSDVSADTSILHRLQHNVEGFADRCLVLDANIAALRSAGRMREALALTLFRHHESRKVLRAHCPPVTIPTGEGVQIDKTKWDIELAKNLKTRGYDNEALISLQQNQDPHARLLWARWASSSELLTPQCALAEFEQLVQTNNLMDDEKAWFYYARYCDSLHKTVHDATEKRRLLRLPSADAPPPSASASTRVRAVIDTQGLLMLMLRAYFKCARVCQRDRAQFVLSRILQLCWDFCRDEVLVMLKREWGKIPSWKWYLVLPQLLTRIHHKQLSEVIIEIVSSLGRKYCLHCSWYFLALHRSSLPNHSIIGKALVQKSCDTGNGVRDKENRKIYHELLDLAGKFQTVAEVMQNSNNNMPPLFKLSAHKSQVLQDLVRWRGNENVMMPLLRQFSVETLPRDDSTNVTQYSSVELVTLMQFKDEVEVLKSKVKPKKVFLIGNKGEALPFLLKAEKRGDMRKDSRMMEVATMLNHVFAKDPESRRRNLEVSTYAVVPLRDTVGLIEWVPNTRSMKSIIEDTRRIQGYKGNVQQQIRHMMDPANKNNARDKYNMFVQQILPEMKPVFHKWFQSCQDPAEWFARRQTYCKSLAAWSILGFFVGLGDRHGENILVDTKTARLVHVDFDCLFQRGLELEVPELVPFRLTQNCLAPLGPTGVEGAFRSYCEITCRLMRANRGIMLCILHSIIGDPLVDMKPSGQIEYAQNTMADLEKKFNGMVNYGATLQASSTLPDKVRKIFVKDHARSSERCARAASQGAGHDRGAGLSVEGQVDELIKAAMCEWNLAQMYVGWMAWQ